MDVQEQLPLTESTFFIILSLAPGPKHGYAILKEVEALSEGRVVLSTGTLYGALKRMLEGGWIERVEDPEPDGSGRERKAYRLTDLGRRILEAETARLRKLAGMAELRTQRKAI
jgi:DNA-binding PadR family transcriptional regulator